METKKKPKKQTRFMWLFCV